MDKTLVHTHSQKKERQSIKFEFSDCDEKSNANFFSMVSKSKNFKFVSVEKYFFRQKIINKQVEDKERERKKVFFFLNSSINIYIYILSGNILSYLILLQLYSCKCDRANAHIMNGVLVFCFYTIQKKNNAFSFPFFFLFFSLSFFCI